MYQALSVVCVPDKRSIERPQIVPVHCTSDFRFSRIEGNSSSIPLTDVRCLLHFPFVLFAQLSLDVSVWRALRSKLETTRKQRFFGHAHNTQKFTHQHPSVKRRTRQNIDGNSECALAASLKNIRRSQPETNALHTRHHNMTEIHRKSSRRRLFVATVALVQMFSTTFSYQYPHSLERLRLTFRSVPGFQKIGSIGRETSDRFNNQDLPDQLSQIEQANVDDYLVFLERRYQRLNDENPPSEHTFLAWNWLLETKSTKERQMDHKNALHILGVANLASQKLLQKDGIHSRSLFRRLSFQRNWLSELKSLSNRSFRAFWNTLKRTMRVLESVGEKRKNAPVVATASVMVFLSVLRLVNVVASPLVMALLWSSHPVFVARQQVLLSEPPTVRRSR